MRTKLKLCVGGLLAFFASVLLAADRTYQNAGGDLASTDSADWGGTSPGSSDNAIINQAGTYTLSDDVEFKYLRVRSNGSAFNFSDHKLTAQLFVENVENAYNVFSGGRIDANSAYVRSAYNANGMTTVFKDGCIVTNVANFFATSCNGETSCSYSKTEIAGGAKFYVGCFKIYDGGGNKIYAHDNTLEIYDGGQLYVTNRIYSDVNEPDSPPSYGGQSLIVRGSGSLLHDDSTSQATLGHRCGSNKFRFADNATAYFRTGVQLGKGMNSILVENCATCNLVRVNFQSSDNVVSVSNAVLNCNRVQSGNPLFVYSADASNNLFRVYGPDTSLTLGVNTGDFFGESNSGYNTVSFEGGVSWYGGTRTCMMARTHHSVFRVTGDGTSIGRTGAHFYFGDNTTDESAVGTFNSVSNRLEVLDGATFNAKRLPVMGIANTVCISNATANIGGGSDSVGLRVGYNVPNGYSNSTNCVLVLQGTTPKVEINSAAVDNAACWFSNGATLRFEIPKEGYADGYVPLTTNSKFLMDDEASKLEIDCAEFVAKTGGKLHLIHAEGGITAASKTRLAACASTLPERCTLIVDDKDVYIKSPRVSGFIISFW